MATEYKLPPLKENVEIVEVNSLKVAEGDTVQKDQALMEVQADKAALEVPSPATGTVSKVLVKVGDQVKIGQAYIVISEGGAAPAKAAAPKATAPPPAAAPAPAAPAPAPAPVPVAQPVVAPAPLVAPTTPVAITPAAAAANLGPVSASPGTRRLARELGVDLHRVSPTAKHGQVTEDDLKNYVRQALSAGGGGGGGAPVAPPLPRFEDLGPVERVPMMAIRRATAKQMALAWSQIPHVTQNDQADVTDLEDFRRSQSAASKGPKLTVTAFALKAASILLREFPAFNASIDTQNNQIVLKKYIHIGIAVDTEAGLLVPVVKDVDKKSVHELAAEVTSIAERARTKKLDGADLTGGTFTITNLGGIGGTGFTPIVNWPEVAILGVSRGRMEPVLKGDQWVPRLMVPLSLSYDHRIIDGAAAARFLRRMADLLEQPMHMLLHA